MSVAEKVTSIKKKQRLRLVTSYKRPYVNLSKLSGYVLPVLGFAAFTVGAWMIRTWLGLFVLGASLFILDYGRRD